ncbi:MULTISPECIES: hypothetical protein [Rhodococcus erythropolis group]|uniref:hypothetical protein n=1 Tax=Rhodococcus erythropolis group TaxID=2840174 RepID=UPI001BEA0108|nr:hypothetical protein [Rhodococcus erythropolis]MBT2268793.1 hypothetical protein [Rhodococcus erythropolis]
MQYKHLHAKPRVVVNLLSGTSISGVIVSTRGPLVTVKSAFIHEDGREAMSADGEIAIDKANIDFIQAL